jgi:hypothetical protein
MKLKSGAGKAKPEATKQILFSYGWVPWSNEDQPSNTGGSHRTVETHWLILEQWRLSLGYSWSSGGSVRKEPSGISSSNIAYPLPWSRFREPQWEVKSYLGAIEGLIRG